MSLYEPFENDQIRLSIKENAVDYLDEALFYCALLDNDNLRASKFALINIASFIEVGLKYCYSLHDGNSIYTGEITAGGRPKTIAVSECRKECVRLYGIQTDHIDVLKQIAEERNDVVHGKVDIRALDVRVQLANGVAIMADLWTKSTGEPLADSIKADNQKSFNGLTDSFWRDLTEAQKAARDEIRQGGAYRLEYVCLACSSRGTRVKRPNDFYCHMCHKQEMLNNCFHCSQEIGEQLTRYIGKSNGHELRFCEECAMALTMSSDSHYETFMKLDEREPELDAQIQWLHS